MNKKSTGVKEEVAPNELPILIEVDNLSQDSAISSCLPRPEEPGPSKNHTNI